MAVKRQVCWTIFESLAAITFDGNEHGTCCAAGRASGAHLVACWRKKQNHTRRRVLGKHA